MRRHDWRVQLKAYIERVRHQRFCPGKLDCGLFVAGAVEAITGTDYGKDFRGRYTTLNGGTKAIRRAGYIDAIDYVQSLFSPIHISHAQVGDIAVIETESGPALGVVNGAHIFVMTSAGVGSIELLRGVRAFRIE